MSAAAVMRCSAADEPEDPSPTATPSLTLMQDDDDARETTETLAPPTDRDAKTNPENLKPEHRDAIAPQPDPWDTKFIRDQDSVFAQAVEMVARAGRRMDEERQQRADDETSAAQRHEEQLKQTEQVLAAVKQADQNNTSGWQNTQAQISSFRAELVSQDAELKALRAEIETLKAQLAQLERRLDEKQSHGPARSPTPAAT